MDPESHLACYINLFTNEPGEEPLARNALSEVPYALEPHLGPYEAYTHVS